MVANDDEAWRAIVDNYGDRPDLDQVGPSKDAEDAEDAKNSAPSETSGEPLPGPQHPAAAPTWGDAFTESAGDQDRFVPPPPPPVPTTTTDRMIAWTGVFGSPAVLLVLLVLGLRPPSLINYVLVLGFVGGFLYLVVKMNREPRDPDDNGAVL